MQQQSIRLRPELTLADVLTPGVAFNIRPSWQGHDWLNSDPAYRDSITGAALTVAGGVPMVCSRSTVSPLALNLLEEAGLPCTADILEYNDAAEYDACLDGAARRPHQVAFQYAQAPRERPADLYWVPRDVLEFLNNKANLPLLVPSEHVARRQLLAPDQLKTLESRLADEPLALKAISKKPCGGGTAVVLARAPADLEVAFQKFQGCEQVIVEEFLEIKENFCLNYATVGDRIEFLGAGLQVTDKAGTYRGSWLDPNVFLPPEAVELGRFVMQQAQQRGYKGIAGFDMVLDSHERITVIDLNFRYNGSTTALLLRSAIDERFGPGKICRLLRWYIPNALANGERIIRRAIGEGYLLPTSFFDAQLSYHPTDNSKMTCLLLGDSREEICGRQQQIEKQGFLQHLNTPA